MFSFAQNGMRTEHFNTSTQPIKKIKYVDRIFLKIQRIRLQSNTLKLL